MQYIIGKTIDLFTVIAVKCSGANEEGLPHSESPEQPSLPVGEPEMVPVDSRTESDPTLFCEPSLDGGSHPTPSWDVSSGG